MKRIYTLITAAALSLTVSVAQTVQSGVLTERLAAAARTSKALPKLQGCISVPAAECRMLETVSAAAHKTVRPAARTAGSTLALASNRKYLGVYTSDSYMQENGIGLTYESYISYLPCDLRIASFMYADEMTKYDGSNIVGLRFALASEAEVSNVFIYPVGTDGEPSGEPLAVKTVSDVCQAGWNEFIFDTPIELDVSEYLGFLVGYTYFQTYNQDDGDYPLSLVPEGSYAAPIYLYGLWGNNPTDWASWGIETLYGNLSVQLIAENDRFMEKDIQLSGMAVGKDWNRCGDGLDFAFYVSNFGNTAIGTAVFGIAVDDDEIGTFNVDNITNELQTVTRNITVPQGLTLGQHILKVYAKTVDGEVPAADTSDDAYGAYFYVYDKSVARQKTLMEYFTSQYGSYCQNCASDLQDFVSGNSDIVWVSLHGDMNSGDDQFTLEESSDIMQALDCTGFPSVAFNRTYSPYGLTTTYFGDSYTTDEKNSIYSNIKDYTLVNPALATVNINGTYDSATRQLSVTVSGNGVDVDELLGGYGLTVYLTEDGITAQQKNSSGTMDADYVHDHVLRAVLTNSLGNAVNWSGDTYENTYSTTLDAGWNADNMNVVAFIAPIFNIDNPDYLHEWVTNANSVKLTDIASGIKGVALNDGNAVETVRYNAAGQAISGPQKGLNIIRLSNGKTMKVAVR